MLSSKENQVSLVRTFLSAPGSESKIGRLVRQMQEYCLAGGSWSTVGPLASASRRLLNRTLVYQIKREEAPPGNISKALLEGKPTVQLNRTLDFPETCLAHQNRTIAIASDFRVDGAKSPEIP